MTEVRWDGEDLILAVRVQPRASREKILGFQAGGLKVALTAPPVDGAANEALQRLLAKALNVAQGCVQIIQGNHSRNKLVRIQGVERNRTTTFLASVGLKTP